MKFEDKSELMAIDIRQTVLELKKILQNVTGLTPASVRVFHREELEEQDPCTKELKWNNKKLYLCNINEGDEICIYRKSDVGTDFHTKFV